MRRLLCMLFLIALSGGAHAARQQPSESCKNLDMSNVDDVYACLQDDHKFEYVGKHQFDARVSCIRQQDKILERYIVSTYLDPGEQRAMLNASRNRNGRSKNDELPRPSCETIAEISYRITGDYPSWQNCLGYDAAPDKFAHFKRCTASYHQAISRLKTEEAAQASLASFDCTRLRGQHQHAMRLMYPRAVDESGKSYYGPADLVLPECDEIEVWLAELKLVKLQLQQTVREEQQLALEERLARREADRSRRDRAEAQVMERRRRQQEVERALDQSYVDIYPEITKAQMERLRNSTHPADRIDASHIKNGLILALHDYVPEESKLSFGIRGTLKHTVGGFKAFTDLPNAYIVYHTVSSVDSVRCDSIEGQRTTCQYRVSTSTTIDKRGADLSPAMQQLFQFAGAGRPVIKRYESAFKHNGLRWQPLLSSEQYSGLMPPQPAAGNGAGFYGDDERAALCAIGDWMAC